MKTKFFSSAARNAALVGSLAPAATLTAALAMTSGASAMEGTGLQTSVAVDLVGQFKVGKDSEAEDTLQPRGAEFMFYAPIDHIFDGVLSFAAHPENGEKLAELHEATISSSKLIPRSTIKVGQLFPSIGRLGRFHQHDWPFITAPKVHQTIFAKENIIDTGAEYSFLLPTSLYLDITAGVTNGWTYGHSHTKGEKPRTPTHYARTSTYTSLGSGGWQLGLNYLGRRSEDGTKMTIGGVDSTMKWRQGAYLLFLLQGEAWYRTTKPLVGEKEDVAGAYLYPQYGITSSVAAGVRLDYYTVASLKDAKGDKVGNADVAVVPTITYKASEFSTLRLAYTHGMTTQDGQKDKLQRMVETQATFIIGAHPAHDF